MEDKGKKDFSQSVDNAIKVLNCFVDREECGISELSRELGISKAGVSRLVASLERNQFLMQNSASGKYRLGIGLLMFGTLAQERNALSRTLTPIMRMLAEKYQATSHLAAMMDNDLVIINKVSAGPFIYMSSRVGGTLSAHATAMGKCILAFSQPERVQHYIEQTDFRRFTSHTITDKAALAAELEKTRQRGYAVDDEETHEGLFCISCPVFDMSHNPIAAVSISGQKVKMKECQHEVADYIRDMIKTQGF